MNDTEFESYVPRLTELFVKGYSPSQAATVVLLEEDKGQQHGADSLTQYKAADCAADPRDRAIVERVVKYAAEELGITPPRVRFFRSEGLSLKGVTHTSRLDEIWVAADRPWYEMAEIALHEVGHVGHLTDDPTDLDHESAERVAVRFADRGKRIGWIQSAARAAR